MNFAALLWIDINLFIHLLSHLTFGVNEMSSLPVIWSHNRDQAWFNLCDCVLVSAGVAAFVRVCVLIHEELEKGVTLTRAVSYRPGETFKEHQVGSYAHTDKSRKPQLIEIRWVSHQLLTTGFDGNWKLILYPQRSFICLLFHSFSLQGHSMRILLLVAGKSFCLVFTVEFFSQVFERWTP